MKNYTNHKIDYASKTITLSKSFYEKACNIKNKTEFNEMKTLRTEFPDFTFIVKQIKKNKDKKTYKNLTYENMEAYIKAVEENSDIVLEELKKVKAKACIQTSPYTFVKRWFLKQYPDYMEKEEANEETVNEEKNTVWKEKDTSIDEVTAEQNTEEGEE